MAIFIVRTVTPERGTGTGFDSYIVEAADAPSAILAASVVAPLGGAAPGPGWSAINISAAGSLDVDPIIVDGRCFLTGEQLRGA